SADRGCTRRATAQRRDTGANDVDNRYADRDVIRTALLIVVIVTAAKTEYQIASQAVGCRPGDLPRRVVTALLVVARVVEVIETAGLKCQQSRRTILLGRAVDKSGADRQFIHRRCIQPRHKEIVLGAVINEPGR